VHKWKYRNPYDRTCELCGRHENTQARVFSRDDGSEYIAAEWWEEMYPLATKKCIGRFTAWLQEMFLPPDRAGG
jgi:hypothetical protein